MIDLFRGQARAVIGIDPEMLNDSQQFRSDYGEKQEQQLKLWEYYISKHSIGQDIIRTQDLLSLLSESIPDDLRGNHSYPLLTQHFQLCVVLCCVGYVLLNFMHKNE